MTTTRSTALASGNVLVATYKGGKKLNVKLGTKLVIDGDDLKALSVATGFIANNAVNGLKEDTSLTSPGAWSTSDVPLVGGVSLEGMKSEIGVLPGVVVDGFPIPVGSHRRFGVRAGTPSGRSYAAYIAVTVGSSVIVIDSQSFGTMNAGDIARASLSGVAALPDGSYDIYLYIVSSANTTGSPLPDVHSTSTYNALAIKK